MIFLSHQSPVDFLIIENFFSPEEEKSIWKELDFLTEPNKLLGPADTDTAKDSKTGKNLKQNKGIFLDFIYSDKNVSNILSLNEKIVSPEVKQAIKNLSPYYGIIDNVNATTTLVSYYEDQDYYEPHTDKNPITVLYYFYKEPKKFTGGELVLMGKEIEVKNNMAVIFFGCFEHSVNPVNYSGNPYSGHGRYCISQFLGIV
jgi:Rps23 Pro-64 3,4-dihydroxylase Tpa1-like proline 4-hydroxylase